jgi:hypothetical protein
MWQMADWERKNWYLGTLKKNFHTSLVLVLVQRLIFGWYEAKYNNLCYRDWHETGTRLVFMPQILATKLV